MTKQKKIKAIKEVLRPEKKGAIRTYINGRLSSEHPSHDKEDHIINITIVNDGNEDEGA
jgi:hypothetical protein